MKKKRVRYYDLFDPDRIVEASNHLLTGMTYHRFNMDQYIKTAVNFYRSEDQKGSRCRCHHPMFSDGVCHYRQCAHSTEEHN